MKSDSSLKHYLSQLNNHDLLTKDEEIELLKSIELRQKKILRSCLDSSFFLSELHDLLTKHATDGMVKLSRKINDDSTKEEVALVEAAYINLVDMLDTGSIEEVEKCLDEVSLSGTIINSLVQRIKKKYTKINDCDEVIISLMRYFEVKSEDELDTLITSIKDDQKVRHYYCSKFYTVESKLLSRCHDYEDYKSQIKSLEQQGLTMDQLSEVKSLYKAIIKMEHEMKRFKDELVQKNLRLVVSRAKKHLNKGLEFEDLIQEGNLGLMKAINKHDASRGTKISTYATWWIDQSIKRSISNKGRTVRIPTHIEFQQSNIAKAIHELSSELRRPPTTEEIAHKMKIPVEKLKSLETVAMHKVGIEDELSSGISLLDILPSDSSQSPFNTTSRTLLREKIRKILSTLPPRTQKIIRLRFGIGDPHEEMTLQQIADQIGLTKQGVRLIQEKGLQAMKKKGVSIDD